MRDKYLLASFPVVLDCPLNILSGFDAGSGDLKNEQLSRLDSKLGGALQQLCRENKFVGKSGTTCQARFFSGAGNGDQAMTSKAVALVGLGASCELANVTSWSRFGMQVASIALSANWPKTSVSVCGIERSLCSHSSIRAAFSSMLANSFVDDSFRSVTDAKTAGNFHAIGFGENAGPALVEAEKFARGIRSTMHLVNSPANRMTPSALAKVAIDLEEKYSDCMKAKILNREDCKAYGKHGMGLFLGVSQGSDEPPKFIHLTYTGEADPENPNREIAFIGKGVTFDSGGMNIKFGKDSLIDVMKFDMGGAAAVLGAAATIGDIKPRGVTVHFVIAACENMINGVALKPGDVITASDGTTVEVNNTDAEGRLTMADALLYVQNELPNCKEVIDIATLTGACIVALGDSVAGLITPSESMADKVQTAALTAGEDVWRLPLHKAYRKGLKSLVADMKNSGPRAGGTIIAALFLKDFVKDSNNLQWAHLDIAGPVWNNDRGATGFGVSTLVQYVLQN